MPAAASADAAARVPVGGTEGTKSSRVVREGTDAGPAGPAAQVFLAGDSRRLADYARAVSDPRDFRYGHFLTPGQVRARFGPAQYRIDAVSGWLSIIVGFTSGYAPDAIVAYERAFQEGAVEGITFTFASGDSGGGDSGGGDIGDGVRTVEYPASSPWVTAVGGTTLAIGPGNSHRWEIGWATDETSLSADGTSWDPAPPGYQGCRTSPPWRIPTCACSSAKPTTTSTAP
jgi:subtilase family serine protease